MERRKEFINEIHKKIDEINEELINIEAKIKKVGKDAKNNYSYEISELKKQKELAEETVTKLSNVSEAAAEDIFQGAEKAFNDLKNAFVNATSRFT